MDRNYKLFIEDIKECIRLIEKYTKNVSEEQFKKDVKIQDAVIRRLEIIGEASKRIPKSIRNVNKHIDWESFAMYRNFITHSYFEASLDRIWNITQIRIPKLKEAFENIKVL